MKLDQVEMSPSKIAEILIKPPAKTAPATYGDAHISEYVTRIIDEQVPELVNQVLDRRLRQALLPGNSVQDEQHPVSAFGVDHSVDPLDDIAALKNEIAELHEQLARMQGRDPTGAQEQRLGESEQTEDTGRQVTS